MAERPARRSLSAARKRSVDAAAADEPGTTISADEEPGTFTRMRKSVRDFVQSPTTQMMGLYIASQHLAPAGLDYLSEELKRQSGSNKKVADLIKYGAIPLIKVGGYAYGANMAQRRLDKRFRDLSRSKRA